MKINLCANWFGELYRGHVTVECTAYKGGVIVRAWQLKNNEIDIDNRGMFIFPLADGTINMPDGHGGYKECWYGEVVKRLSKTNNEIKYFRVNPVNDKVIGLDDIKIIRHGGDLFMAMVIAGMKISLMINIKFGIIKLIQLVLL